MQKTNYIERIAGLARDYGFYMGDIVEYYLHVEETMALEERLQTTIIPNRIKEEAYKVTESYMRTKNGFSRELGGNYECITRGTSTEN